MRAEDVVRSAQNPLVQRVRQALSGKEPGTLVLQGDRLVDDALGAGVRLESVLVAEGRAERARELVRRGAPVRVVAADLLERVGTLATSPGIVALAAAPAARDLAQIELGPRAVVLVVAGVGDPGNLGALARAAEAFGASALVALRGGASPWNEKALRGSMGSLLRLPVVAGADADEVARALAQRGVRGLRAATRGGRDPRTPVALWIGGETGALPAAAQGCEPLTIPMRAEVESLNVTVAAAILLHELARRSDGPAGR
jgi:TrmH family RNA methyltransferase